MMLLCLEEALEHFSDCSIEATRPMPGKNSGVCLGIILVLSVKGKAATGARESTPTPPLPSERRGMQQGKSHRGDRG
jgi:hypothetical protein